MGHVGVKAPLCFGIDRQGSQTLQGGFVRFGQRRFLLSPGWPSEYHQERQATGNSPFHVVSRRERRERRPRKRSVEFSIFRSVFFLSMHSGVIFVFPRN